jgi:hypothetical protein
VKRLRGQAMVEYGISLTVVLLLTIGVVDLGRGVWAYNTVAHLARDGARFAAVPSHSAAQIETYVRSRCTAMLSNPCPAAPDFSVIVAPRGIPGQADKPATVCVTYPFQAVMASFWGGGAIDLKAKSRMYVEKGLVDPEPQDEECDW